MSHFLAAQAVATQLAEEVEQDLDVEQASSDQYFVERNGSMKRPESKLKKKKLGLKSCKKRRNNWPKRLQSMSRFPRSTNAG